MKKFNLVILMIICFLFLGYVDASTVYKRVPNIANDYIKHFPKYQKYVVTENTSYGLSGGNIINSTENFKNGGLLNLDEYNISKSAGNSTYLFNGLSFFTMTKVNGKIQTIDPNSITNITELTVNDSSGVRVTNYIKGDVKLAGNGSSVNPWTIISKYTVKFYYDDEKILISPSSVEVDEEGRTTPVAVTSLPGYRYVSNDCGAVYVDNKLTLSNVTSDVICHVEAGLREYDVIAHTNCGTIAATNGWMLSSDNKTATMGVEHGSKISVFPTATCTGHSFGGWFTEETGGTLIDGNTIIRDDLNIYAQWIPNEYTLTYNNNGGSGCSFKKANYGTPWGSLCTPTYTGFGFKEWNTKEDGTGTKILESTVVGGDLTVYAIWDANKYTVTLNADGGTIPATTGWTLTDSNTKANRLLSYGSTYGTLPTPTRTGYTFTGWYNTSNNKITSSTNVSIASAHTLTAKWTTNKYTVKFATTSGCTLNSTVYAQISNIEYDALVKTSAIANPTCAGYDFTGWIATGNINVTTALYGNTNNPTTTWVDGNKGTFFKNLSTTSGGTVTLTAGWTIKKPTVTADATGGIIPTTIGWTLINTLYDYQPMYCIDNGNGTYSSTGNVTVEGAISCPPLFSTCDAEHVGEFRTGNCVVSIVSNPNLATKKVTYNSTYGTLPTPTRSGYRFNGWSTSSNGTGNTVTSSTTVTNYDDHTIYAKWLTEVSTISTSACSNPYYNGSSQSIVKAAGTGYTWSDGNTRIDEGSQTVTATLQAGYVWSDGTTGTKTVECSILPKEVSVSWGSTTEFTYNGSDQAPTASVTTGVSGETMTVKRTQNTNASSSNYTSTASCDSVSGGRAKCSNYKLTNTTKPYKINPRAVTIKASDQSKAYNGTALSANNTCEVTSGSLVSGHTPSCTCSGSQTDVGSGTKTLSTAKVMNGSSDVSSNYTITKSNGTLTVTKVDPTCPTVTAYSGTYDGNSHTVTVSGGSGGTIKYEKSIDGGSTYTDQDTTNPVRVSAGTTYTRVRIVGDNNHNDKTCDTKTVTIAKKAVTIKASNQSKTYNGTALEADTTCEVTSGSVVSGHTLSCTSTGSQTDAGSSTKTLSTAKVMSGSTDLSSNYTITKSNGTLTVTAVDPTCPTVTAYSGTYDGNSHTVTVSGGSGGTIKYEKSIDGGSTYTDQDTTNPVRVSAGTTYTRVRIVGDNNHNDKTCDTKTVTIAKKAVTIKASNQSKTYNGTALEADTTCEVTSGSVVSGHTPSCTSTGSQTNVGSSTKTLSTAKVMSGSTDLSSNYTITKANGTLTVNKANPTCPTVTAYSGTYDGNSHTVTVSGGSGGTIKYEKSIDGGSTYTDQDTTNPVRVSAGTTYTRVRIVGDSNHNDKTCDTKTITINKATPTITLSASSGSVAKSKTITFTEKATVKGKFTVTSSATGKATVTQASSAEIAANTTNTVTVKGVAAGSATITVTFTPTDTTNYNNAANKTYSVTVTDASCNCNVKYKWSFSSAVRCKNDLYQTSSWTACSDYGSCASAAAAACQNRQGNYNSPSCTKYKATNCGNWVAV